MIDIEKIVDYSFERNDKSNVLAIHPTRPLIAYLINIQLTQKIAKGWSSGNEAVQSPNQSDKNKLVSIRIIDYVTRARCLAKGVYHARPADCVFTINSLLCSQSDIFKFAVVDKLANIYLYDLTYFLTDIVTTRIAVIRGPSQDISPYEYITLVWCPFVPCEDFDDGDGGLRLALSTDSKIEIFAIDRLQGRTGEIQRSDLKGAYKCIHDAHNANIVSLSISPDCSTISAAALDNRVTFFSSDIDDGGQRCLHNWEASITDKSSISKLFFLDNYPRLLEDSTMKFWGAAFIGTRSGQMLLVDLRTWSVYQRMTIPINDSIPKNFEYRIDMTSRNIIAMNGNLCFVIQVENNPDKLTALSSNNISNSNNHNEISLIDGSNVDIFNYLSKVATPSRQSNQQKSSGTAGSGNKKHSTTNMNDNIMNESNNGLPRIVKTTKLTLNNPIYSFAIKYKSEQELELFTISAYSLERCTIKLDAIKRIDADADKLQKQKQQHHHQQQEQEQQQKQQQNLNRHHNQQQQPQQQIIDTSMMASFGDDTKTSANTPNELKRFLQQFNGSARISSSGNTPQIAYDGSSASSGSQAQVPPMQPIQPNVTTAANVLNDSPVNVTAKSSLDIVQMDRMVEALFTKLNTAFGQGLDEFLNDVKCEVNDLKLKLNSLCRDVRKLQQQLQETRLQK